MTIAKNFPVEYFLFSLGKCLQVWLKIWGEVTHYETINEIGHWEFLQKWTKKDHVHESSVRTGFRLEKHNSLSRPDYEGTFGERGCLVKRGS